ncbi:MAG: hypothetical protein MI785_22470 [Kiloniellales bacterium]|nr:hypothetical protein [Kiloniellales bacterium]
MKRWYPDWELDRLMQALEQEALAVGEEELGQVLAEARLSEARLSKDGSLRQVAKLLRSALAEFEDPTAEASPAAAHGLGDRQARWPH